MMVNNTMTWFWSKCQKNEKSIMHQETSAKPFISENAELLCVCVGGGGDSTLNCEGHVCCYGYYLFTVSTTDFPQAEFTLQTAVKKY